MNQFNYSSAESEPEAFFESLDINDILDQVLKRLNSSLSCSNSYWIKASEMDEFLRADPHLFELVKQTKYTSAPFIRSLRCFDFAGLQQSLQKFCVKDGFLGLDGGEHRILVEGETQRLLLAVASRKSSQKIGYLLIETTGSSSIELQLRLLQKVLKPLIKYIEFGYEHWRVKNLSYIDDLTDLYNQRYLPMVLEQEINRCQRQNNAFSILFIDVDYFKMVNDSLGHWVGSKVLTELGHLLKASIRSCDYAFRYGGDEYVILLVDTDREKASLVAERIRKAVESSKFLISGHRIHITISIGLASFPEHAQSSQQIIEMADQAMYYGKHKSRNIVYVAS